jgi:hypothetical protein
MNFKIYNLTPETEKPYFCCLEEWSDDMKEAGPYKQKWYQEMKDKGLFVKLAIDEKGVPGGMIQCVPIEHSMFEGENLYIVLCIWVHGHKKGPGNLQHKGMGTALLKAAEEECLKRGTNGLVTWGLIIPVFMRAAWFKQHGYQVVEKNGFMRLMWKPFSEKALPPRFMVPRKKPGKDSARVDLTLFRNGWCSAQNIACERALRASAEFPDKISCHTLDTIDRELVREWGIFDGIFLEGKEIRTGPPPSYETIKKKMAKAVRIKMKNLR